MQSSSWSIRRLAGWVRNEAEAAGESLRARVSPLSGRSRFGAAGDGAPGASTTSEFVCEPRIVLDGVFFQLHRTGIARMWESVMAEWSASGFAEHVVVLDRAGSAPKLPGFTYRPFTPLRRFDTRAQQRALESVCRAEHADVFISTYSTLPVAVRSVACVYDMIPEVTGFDLSLPEWRAKRAVIAHASAYVAISQSTADDLHRLYPRSAEAPVDLAYPAVAPHFTPAPAAEVDALRQELDLPADYVVFIGARDVAYKNAPLIFEALAEMPVAQRPALLCVGGAPELEEPLRAIAADSVVRVARLTDGQLRAAYSGARALVYPSRYEGFGIPILEAMACGCPVITCRNSSLPEAAGDAALYVPDDDVRALASAIGSLADPDVANGWRVRGAEQAARFSWRETADAIEASLRRAAKRR